MAVKDNNYESFFSYNVTRNYPYRWFTPTAVVGGLLCTILFSILNYAANSYDLVTHTTNDLNSTLTGPSSLRRWPLYFRDKVQPTCEPTNIPVGSQLFTNQTALTYQLEGVWQMSSDGANNTTTSSIAYSRNVIENCSITAIGMDLAALDRSASQVLASEWGCKAKTFITCAFDSLDGVVNVNLTQSYDLIPPLTYWGYGTFPHTAFIDTDNQTRASLWWGEAALATYWAGLVSNITDTSYQVTMSGKPAIRKGTMYFYPSGNTTDIKDLGFFNLIAEFFIDLGLGNATSIGTGQTIAELGQAGTYPNIWILADSLAKSLYSAIMTDLGQKQAKSNFLVNADDLQYFTKNFTYINSATEVPLAVVGVDYDTIKNETGPLGTSPSVIDSQYICQVPQLKSTGNIFISILVADLVFLQTAWTIFTFVVGMYLDRTTQRNPNSENREGYQTVEVTDVK